MTARLIELPELANLAVALAAIPEDFDAQFRAPFDAGQYSDPPQDAPLSARDFASLQLQTAERIRQAGACLRMLLWVEAGCPVKDESGQVTA